MAIEYANEWVLDLNDAGYWMARWHEQTYPIGYDKQAAVAFISKLNESHRPNLGLHGSELWVCWNVHGKSQNCEYELAIEKAI